MDIELSRAEASLILTGIHLVTIVVLGSAIAIWRWRRYPESRRGRLAISILRWTGGVFVLTVLLEIVSWLARMLIWLLSLN